jgi:hypothetical protein
MRTLLSGQATGGADLLSFVDRLERSVPEAMRSAQQPGSVAAAGTTPVPPFRPESAGIFALITEAVGMARVKRQLDDTIAETNTLRKSLDQLRAPIVADLTAAVRRSDAATNDSASQTVEQMDADRKEIEALSARFKQVSAAMMRCASMDSRSISRAAASSNSEKPPGSVTARPPAISSSVSSESSSPSCSFSAFRNSGGVAPSATCATRGDASSFSL